MYRYLLILMLGALPVLASAQDFMMQGWYWDYPKPGCNSYTGPSLAAEMAARAAAQKNAGFTMMWLPPMTKASFGNCSNGYDPKDIYDYGQYSGATGLGAKAEIQNWLSALSSNNILPVADVVYNHRDGGDWEDNPAVRNYIGIPPSGPWPGCGSATPYPVNGKLRYRLPLGGSSGNGAGDYYFKFSSASGNAGFNGRPYKLYFRTQNTTFVNDPINESEPNGGSDCGQPNKQIFLGKDIFAVQEVGGGCNTDAFYLNLGAGDFNSAGDNIEIYIEEVGGGGSGIDQRIYSIKRGPNANDPEIIQDLAVQTRTNFSGLPSGKGGMNYLNFKPNGSQFTCMTGDEEYPYFFFDVEQTHPTTGTAYRDWNKFLWDSVGIRGYRMDAVKHFPAWFVGALLNEMHAAGMNPPMVVGEHFISVAPNLKGWVDAVYNSMNSEARNAIAVRAFDFELRQALKNACDDGLYDVRNVFDAGLVAAGASGFNSVTFINNHDYRTPGEHILNRMMLAYAYILTNNKVGLPCVFYPDYYGVDIYGPSNPIASLQTQIDQLMQVHKNYIAGATFVDYLNREGTPYNSAYLQSGPYDLLLYQIQYGPVPGKDVIVAINFENQPLRVNHTINTARAPLGTQFNLAAGTANYTTPVVENSSNGIPNSIYLDLPAYSYAVFVQGALLPVTLTTFEATGKQKSVQLTWAADTEDQFAGYEAQRSLDGQSYQKIAWVDAKGTAGGPARYELYDNEPAFNQPMYYRLRMVDLDGTAEFSPIRSVTLQQKAEAVLFPNPSKGQFFIRFEEAVQPGTQLEIFDALGRSMARRILEEGALLEELSLDGAENGVYRVRVTKAGQVVFNGVLHHIR